MSSIWSEEESSLQLGNSSEKKSLTSYARARRTSSAEKMFYMPAQRVMSLRDGMTRPFNEYRAGDPFVPILLGLYWLLPPSKISCRDGIEWVVIEEPEMGLHPNGIGAVMGLILELRSRGYKVCVSTHSPHVLDIVWALNFLQAHNGRKSDVVKLLSLKSNPKTQSLAENILRSSFKTYYFSRDGSVSDISGLDSASDNAFEGGWGGLTEFSSRVGDVVAEVARRDLPHCTDATVA